MGRNRPASIGQDGLTIPAEPCEEIANRIDPFVYDDASYPHFGGSADITERSRDIGVRDIGWIKCEENFHAAVFLRFKNSRIDGRQHRPAASGVAGHHARFKRVAAAAQLDACRRSGGYVFERALGENHLKKPLIAVQNLKQV